MATHRHPTSKITGGKQIYTWITRSIQFSCHCKVLFLAILFLSGCMMPLQPTPQLPDLSLFEEGDIFLTTSGNVQSWFFALVARDTIDGLTVPFSHAEMVFRNEEGEMMLGGVFGGSVQAENLAERFPEFYRVAVFRANAPLDNRKKTGLALLTMINDPQISTAEFDYSMSYSPGKTDTLFCAGIINESCRQGGLTYPFGLRKWKANGLTDHVEEILGTQFGDLLDLSSLYSSDRYRLILEWQNDQISRKTVDLSKKIVLDLLSQYENGWRLKTDKSFHLISALANLSPVEKQLVRLKSSLGGFSGDVMATWNRLSRRGNLDGLDEREKDILLDVVFKKYHKKYFYPAPSAGTSAQQLLPATLSR